VVNTGESASKTEARSGTGAAGGTGTGAAWYPGVAAGYAGAAAGNAAAAGGGGAGAAAAGYGYGNSAGGGTTACVEYISCLEYAGVRAGVGAGVGATGGTGGAYVVFATDTWGGTGTAGATGGTGGGVSGTACSPASGPPGMENPISGGGGGARRWMYDGMADPLPGAGEPYAGGGVGAVWGGVLVDAWSDPPGCIHAGGCSPASARVSHLFEPAIFRAPPLASRRGARTPPRTPPKGANPRFALARKLRFARELAHAIASELIANAITSVCVSH